MGHLDGERDAYQYENPHPHPAAIRDRHALPDLDTQAERYPLAGPDPHKVKNARNYYRPKPCL